MKKYFALLPLLAMMFVSCELQLVEGGNQTGGDQTGGNQPGGGDVTTVEKRVRCIVIKEGVYDSEFNNDSMELQAVVYFTYDDQGRIAWLNNGLLVNNDPMRSFEQKISYAGNRAIIDVTKLAIVNYTNPDRVVLEKSRCEGGEAQLNSDGAVVSYRYADDYTGGFEYDANNKLAVYTGGGGMQINSEWDGDNLARWLGNEVDINFIYGDTLNPWCGLDWMFLLLNGYEPYFMPLYLLNINHGYHSKYLPTQLVQDGLTETIVATLNEEGLVKEVNVIDYFKFELFYEGELIPNWPWPAYDEKVEL